MNFAKTFAPIVFITLLFFSLYAEEPPHPLVSNLKAGWWEAYFAPESPELKDNLNQFYAVLQEAAHTLPDDERQSAKALLKKIDLNFNAYVASAAQPPPPTPTASTIAASYTLDEVITLFQSIQRQKAEINTILGEKNEMEQNIYSTRQMLQQLQGSYASTEKRSIERLLLGLETIALHSELEVTQLNRALLNKTLSDKKSALTFTEEELAAAKQRISVSDLDLFLYAQQVRARQEEWEAAKELYKEKSSAKAKSLSESISAEEPLLHQQLAQEVEQAAIKEALAHIDFIFADAMLALAQLISMPAEIDFNTFYDKLVTSKHEVEAIRNQSYEWQLQAERQLQRIGQAMRNQKSASDHNIIIEVVQQNLLLIQQIGNQSDELNFVLDSLDSHLKKVTHVGQQWLHSLWLSSVAIYYQASSWLSTELFVIAKTPVTLMGILRFIIMIIATFWLSKLAMRAFLRVGLKRKGTKKAVLYKVARLCYYLMLASGFLAALSLLGFDFSNFLLVAGALSVGIGFGLQSIFNNFISGIIILFESHLKVGDYVELESGLRGEIREINVRSTLITDNDGIDVLVPNSEIIDNKVLNWTLKVPYRRVQIPFTTAYGVDKELVARIIIEAAMEVPHTLSKVGVSEPVVRLTKLGDHGLEFELVVWVKGKITKRSRATRSDYLWAIESAFRKHDISIPYPQLNLHIDNK